MTAELDCDSVRACAAKAQMNRLCFQSAVYFFDWKKHPNFTLRVKAPHFLFFILITMKLLTKAILTQFEKVGDQSNEADPLVICKFFYPDFHRTRYATEFNPETKVCFGYVVSEFSERWAFSLTELENSRWKLWLKIERDRFFKSCRFSELVEKWLT